MRLSYYAPEQAIFEGATNLESDSTIIYTPYRNNALAPDESRSKYLKITTNIHEMDMHDLEAGIVYKM